MNTPDTMHQPAIQVHNGKRQLFLDDYGIDSMQGLRRTMHQPAKRGAVIEPQRPWEGALQTRSAPVWDLQEQIYKLWVFSNGEMNYLTSKDGIVWERPPLRQKAWQGSPENNIVTVDPALNWPENAIENVVYDPDEPNPERRYKGFLGCFDRRLIASPDGIRWTLIAEEIKLPSQDESNLSLDADSGTFLATLKGRGPHGRSQNIWTSRDFIHWERQGLFSADEEDQRLAVGNAERRFADPAAKSPFYNIPEKYNCDVYNLGLFRYEELYIGLPSMFHQTGKVDGSWEGFDRYGMSDERRETYKRDGDWSGFHPVQLMCSRDLRNWHRLGDRQPFIDLSPLGVGAYDLETILPPSSPVVKGEELWFYYTGLQSYGGNFAYKDDSGAICLAVLRRDGFVSVDADEQIGTLLTVPLVFHGTRLYVNADAGGGFLEATVLNERNEPVAVAERIVSDDTRHEIRWASGGLADARGQAVRLRFTLRRSSLYAFWFA